MNKEKFHVVHTVDYDLVAQISKSDSNSALITVKRESAFVEKYLVEFHRWCVSKTPENTPAVATVVNLLRQVLNILTTVENKEFSERETLRLKGTPLAITPGTIDTITTDIDLSYNQEKNSHNLSIERVYYCQAIPIEFKRAPQAEEKTPSPDQQQQEQPPPLPVQTEPVGVVPEQRPSPLPVPIQPPVAATEQVNAPPLPLPAVTPPLPPPVFLGMSQFPTVDMKH